MITDIILLIVVSFVITKALQYFLYDLLCFPVNFIYSQILKNSYDEFTNKSGYVSIGGGVFLILVFSYLYPGLTASYVGYVELKHPGNIALKIFANICAVTIPFSMKNRTGRMLLADRTLIRTPGVFATPLTAYISAAVSFSMIVFPRIVKFWSWMPFVHK